MGRIVVDVMPKPEILDPQGTAVAAALPRLGVSTFTAVRQGKRFELSVEGEVTPEDLQDAYRAATTLLSNPVIEDVVRVAAEGGPELVEDASYGSGGAAAGSAALPDAAQGA